MRFVVGLTNVSLLCMLVCCPFCFDWICLCSLCKQSDSAGAHIIEFCTSIVMFSSPLPTSPPSRINFHSIEKCDTYNPSPRYISFLKALTHQSHYIWVMPFKTFFERSEIFFLQFFTFKKTHLELRFLLGKILKIHTLWWWYWFFPTFNHSGVLLQTQKWCLFFVSLNKANMYLPNLE